MILFGFHFLQLLSLLVSILLLGCMVHFHWLLSAFWPLRRSFLISSGTRCISLSTPRVLLITYPTFFAYLWYVALSHHNAESSMELARRTSEWWSHQRGWDNLLDQEGRFDKTYCIPSTLQLRNHSRTLLPLVLLDFYDWSSQLCIHIFMFISIFDNISSIISTKFLGIYRMVYFIHL